MRILFFIRDLSDCGGIQQTTCNLITNLLKKDNQISICVVSIYSKRRELFFSIPNQVEQKVLFNDVINIYKSVGLIKKTLRNVLCSLNYDVLIVQGAEYSLFIANSIWKKQNVIVCEHGYYGFGHFLGFHWRGVKKALLRASVIVTLTSLDAKEYQKRNLRKIPIVPIYNAYSPFLKSDQISYDIKSKTIVSCGSLIPLKRFDILIQIAESVLKNNIDWKWELYGDGPLKDELIKLVKQKGLSDRFFIKGHETDKQKIYHGKSFFVMTSEFEGFGMVLIEAMQYGLPILAYDVNFGPKEIIENDINGFLIKDNDVDSFVEHICYLIQNDDIRSDFSNNARLSLQRFSPDRVANDWINIFKKLGTKK